MLRRMTLALASVASAAVGLAAPAAEARSPIAPVGNWGEYGWQFNIDELVRPGEPPQYVLHLQSTREFECSNYLVKGQMIKSGNNLTLVINGFDEPYVCRPGKGPAHGSFDISVLNGGYNLTLVDVSRTDSYRLIVDSAAYMLKDGPGKPRVAIPTAQRFWRRPPASFSVSCTVGWQHEYLCGEFEKALFNRIPRLHEIWQPDNGYWPYPVAKQVSANGKYTHPTRYFVYNGADDLERAGNVLQNFTKRYMQDVKGASISIHGHNGQEYHSWLVH